MDKIITCEKLDETEYYLTEIYNYSERLNIFESILKHRLSKLRATDPKTLKDKANKVQIFLYNLKKQRYDKQNNIRIELLKQLSFVNKDKKRLTLLIAKKQDTDTYKLLVTSLNSEAYIFPNSKIRYKPVSWSALGNNTSYSNNSRNVVASNGKSAFLTGVLATGMILGIVTTILLNTIKPGNPNISVEQLVSLAAMALYFSTFVYKGIKNADKYTFGIFSNILTNRKILLDKIIQYLGISDVEIIEEEVTKVIDKKPNSSI
jgi:DNA-binding Xre family transcriptional regulator